MCHSSVLVDCLWKNTGSQVPAINDNTTEHADSSGNGDSLPAIASTPVGTGAVADNVVVFSQAESEAFINYARPVEVIGNTMTFEFPTTLPLQVEEIFMVRPTADNPYGFTGKVEAVNGNQVTVSQPLMDEVFESMNLISTCH